MRKAMRTTFAAILLAALMLMAGCAAKDKNEQKIDDGGIEPPQSVDITNAIFSNSNASCAAYVGNYTAQATDKSNGDILLAEIQITEYEGYCTIYSNGIPNHDFAINGSFAARTSAVWETFTISMNPQLNDASSPLSLQYDNAIFLNGVKLDLLAAACYGVGPDPLGKEKIGCFDPSTPWRYDPMHSANDFGEDDNHAHTQPDGAYHYHGDPAAMYDVSGQTVSGVIGYAADGFPIRGPYIDDNGTIRAITSGYVLKDGNRTSQEGEGEFPGGQWDGQFRDDFVWQDGAGDLDACNGRMENGVYSYYVTFSYPWVMGCFMGTPDDSFKKSPP